MVLQGYNVISLWILFLTCFEFPVLTVMFRCHAWLHLHIKRDPTTKHDIQISTSSTKQKNNITMETWYIYHYIYSSCFKIHECHLPMNITITAPLKADEGSQDCPARPQVTDCWFPFDGYLSGYNMVDWLIFGV